MSWIGVHSLRRKLVLLTGGLVTVVFVAVIGLTSWNSRQQLRTSVERDLAGYNEAFVHTIDSILRDRATIILAVRDDMEDYQTRGQMWMHLAARTGEKVFADPVNGGIYAQSYRRKLRAYLRNGQLTGQRMTPQMRRMVSRAAAPGNVYGDGMKFFYIGVRSTDPDRRMREYDQYQDSSLWVPDPRVDAPYNPLERPWYIAGQEAGRRRVVFTEPYAERRTKEALVSGGTSVRVEGTTGTLAAGISIKPIMEQLLTLFDERRASITIFSPGTAVSTRYVPTPPKYVYSSRDPELGEQIRAYDDPDIQATPANRDLARLYDHTRGRESGVLEWNIAGERRLVAFSTVPGIRWKIFTSVSLSSAMSDATSAQKRDTIVSLVGLATLLTLIALLVKRSLAPLDTIRRELADLATTGDLSKRTSVRTRDEVGQMAAAINEMLDNTAAPVRALSEQVNTIARGELHQQTKVDAKGDIATLVDGFDEMTRRLIELEATYRDSSPLTGLPGGVTIELEVQRRIEEGLPFAFCMFDLDNFKPFNDRYGYSRGNLVLKQTARLIQGALSQHGGGDDFVGHVGGDDFVVVSTPERFERVCRHVIDGFDRMIPELYDARDREAGGIASHDREGVAKFFPIMSLTICAVNSHDTVVSDYIRVGEIAAELKVRGKMMAGSNLVVDRRSDGNGTPDVT